MASAIILFFVTLFFYWLIGVVIKLVPALDNNTSLRRKIQALAIPLVLFLYFIDNGKSEVVVPEDYNLDVSFYVYDIPRPNQYGRVLAEAKTRSIGTIEERIAVAMKAAARVYNMVDNAEYVVVKVFDERSKGLNAIAVATLAPNDCKPNNCNDFKWKIEYSDEEISDPEFAIYDAWYSNRDNFQKNGFTDEPAIKAFIANKLGIQESEIDLPYYSTSKRLIL